MSSNTSWRTSWVLKLLHTADVHGRLDRAKASAISELISELKSDGLTEVLLLDSGDSLAGSNTVFLPRERVMRLMNSLGYTAIAVGNREFHYVPAIFTWRARGFSPELLSANLLPPRRMDELSSYMRLRVRDLQVAITGLTPVQYPPGAIWERVFGWRFLDPSEALTRVIREIRMSGGMDLLIVLSHLGLDEDVRLAGSLKEEVDDELVVVLGGHTHVAEVIKEPLLIVHPGAYAESLSEVTILVGEDGRPRVSDVRHVRL